MTIEAFADGVTSYKAELQEQEKAHKTIQAYTSDIRLFIDYLQEQGADTGEELTKLHVMRYKEYMQQNGKSTATINRRIISINKYLKWTGADTAAGTKTIKRQNANSLDGVMSISDYERMLTAALTPSKQAQAAGLRPDLQAWAIMQTLANTGIRFNELQFFTVDNIRAAAKNGNAITVTNKGKQRQIPITKELVKILKDYCTQQGITGGYIFGTRNGTPISNEQISRRLKRIAGYARVNKEKIHPHGFRHLYAKSYMEVHNRIDRLADILGHSSINTTRIYSRASTKELAADNEKLYQRAKLKQKRK